MIKLLKKICFILALYMLTYSGYCQIIYHHYIPGNDVWTDQGTIPDYIVDRDAVVAIDSSLTIDPDVEVWFYGDLTVPATSTLSISYNCELKFGGLWFVQNNTAFYDGYKLLIRGDFTAGDHTQLPVIFTKLSGTDGWGGIIFNNTGKSWAMENCTVEYTYKINTALGFQTYDSRGAIAMVNADYLNMKECTIQNNTALYGAGFYADYSDAFIGTCTFSNNSSTFSGGAMYMEGGSAPDIQECDIYNNSAGLNGGAVVLAGYNDPSFYGCNIYSNTATSNGGAFYLINSANMKLTESDIYSNSVTAGNGGAIYAHYLCDYSVKLCEIHENSVAGGNGAGIFNYESDMDLINNLIVENSGATFGGAVYFEESSGNNSRTVRMNNNTISENQATYGQALYCPQPALPGTLEVVNTLIYSFTYAGNQLNTFLSNNVNSPMFDHCDIDDPNLPPTPNAYGSFNDNPQFATSYLNGYHVHGQNNIPFWLQSPCIDAGNNNVSPVTNYDLEDFTNLRKQDGDFNGTIVIDIGAYENNGSNPSLPPLNININSVIQTNSVFPNPAKDFIYIRTKLETGASFSIFDATGKEVIRGIIRSDETYVNLYALHEGPYFVKFISVINQKVIPFVKY